MFLHISKLNMQSYLYDSSGPFGLKNFMTFILLCFILSVKSFILWMKHT